MQGSRFTTGAAATNRLLLQVSKDCSCLYSMSIQVVPAQGEGRSAVAVGEQTEVADLDEAGRQDVQQEAADELDRIEGHDLAAVVVFGVAPAKAHLAVSQIEIKALCWLFHRDKSF